MWKVSVIQVSLSELLHQGQLDKWLFQNGRAQFVFLHVELSVLNCFHATQTLNELEQHGALKYAFVSNRK